MLPNQLSTTSQTSSDEAEQEVKARLEVEMLEDGRRWREERLCNNQPDKKRKSSSTRGNGTKRGGGACRWEAAV
jgi:hypothetical protein